MNDQAPVRPGICKCTNCGETQELDQSEELPPCPSCGHNQWTQVEGEAS